MLMVSFIRWWYGEGLFGRLKKLEQRFGTTADYFSIALLAKTLFAPFRQISAGRVSGPLGVRWHAWLDRLISRCVGAAFRLITLITGVIVLCLQAVVSVVVLIGWLVLPLLPLVGLLLSVSGWLPWN